MKVSTTFYIREPFRSWRLVSIKQLPRLSGVDCEWTKFGVIWSNIISRNEQTNVRTFDADIRHFLGGMCAEPGGFEPPHVFEDYT